MATVTLEINNGFRDGDGWGGAAGPWREKPADKQSYILIRKIIYCKA